MWKWKYKKSPNPKQIQYTKPVLISATNDFDETPPDGITDVTAWTSADVDVESKGTEVVGGSSDKDNGSWTITLECRSPHSLPNVISSMLNSIHDKDERGT